MKYCNECKWYKPFTFGVCQSGCYHETNIKLDIGPIKKERTIKNIEVLNADNICQLYKRGYFVW